MRSPTVFGVYSTAKKQTHRRNYMVNRQDGNITVLPLSPTAFERQRRRKQDMDGCLRVKSTDGGEAVSVGRYSTHAEDAVKVNRVRSGHRG